MINRLLCLLFVPLLLAACITVPEPDLDLRLTAEAEAPPALVVPTAVPTEVAALPSPIVVSPTAEPDAPTATAAAAAETAVSVSAPACQPRTDWVAYTLQTGDTVFKLAQQIGSSVAELQNGNCLTDASRVIAGQQLLLPTLPPTPTPTATATPAEPAIFRFDLIGDETVGDVRRVTLAWETNGNEVRLGAGNRRRHAQWLDLPASGTHTFELRGTNYPNPPITLILNPNDFDGQDIFESITLDWPCAHPYFFGEPIERCAQAPVQTTLASQQDFENGRMIWLEDLDLILVLYDNGNWQRFDNTWREDEPPDDITIVPPAGFLQPIRGFGLVWRLQFGVREGLGWGVAPEQPYTATYQRSTAESVGQGTLYLTTIDGVTTHEVLGFDVGGGIWRALP